MTALPVTLGDGRHPLSVSAAVLELLRAAWHALGWALLEPRARAARVVAVLLTRGLIAPVVIAGACFIPRGVVVAYCYLIVGLDSVWAWAL